MQIVFVRHGQTAANIDPARAVWDHDSPLTQEGREQIIRSYEVVKSLIKRPALIVASPLLRTRQTADILAEHLKLTINIDDRLREADIGDWHNRFVKDINNDLRRLSPTERPGFRPPHGETWYEVGGRVAELAREKSSKQLETVVFVSHDAPIRFGIGTLINSDSTRWSDDNFPTGSVSLLKGNAKNWQVVFLGRS